MRTLALLTLAAFAGIAQARIDYTATVELPDKLKFEIRVPIKEAVTKFQIPNFAPGHYVLLNSPADVKNVTAEGPEGLEAKVTKEDNNTYSVATPTRGTLVFRYVKTARINEGAFLWQGPYEYMYVLGRKDEACTLSFKGPENFKFATSLDPAGNNKYWAPNYDVLADCPVTAGDFLMDNYTVAGKPHFIVLYGAAKIDVDRPKLTQICKSLTEEQIKFFGGAPYKRYMWHFRVNDSVDGGGGLEHLNSTNISLASGLGNGVISVISHEFFHLWNVKRIRSVPLGPFDYLKIPKTGALWWLEGVTDYYADIILARSKVLPEDNFWSSIVSNVLTTRANENRLKISPYDSSFRVGEANGGRGNSAGLLVNYYNTGWVLGLCLDLELRARTGGVRSLDDVTRALYELCKNDKPGFAEDEIRKQLIRFGGPEMGPIYDKWVMQPGELPVEEQLVKAGYIFGDTTKRTPDLGFRASQSRTDEAMRVISVNSFASGQLKVGDLIVEINGVACVGKSARAIRQGYDAGVARQSFTDPCKLKVKRDGQIIEVSISPEVLKTTVFEVKPVASPSELQLRIRQSWLD